MLRRVNLGEIQLDALPFTAESFASLVKLADEEKISKNDAKKIFRIMAEKGENPEAIAKEKDMLISNDMEQATAIMTGILSRKREFAVLQSVGMTKRQLKHMLIYEGLFYAVGSIIASLILSVVLSPMLGNMMSDMFWFVSYHFTIMPVIVIIPVFLLLGWLIPAVLYRADKGQSIVGNLREL